MKIQFLDQSTIDLGGDVSFDGLNRLGEYTGFDLTAAEEVAARAAEAEILIVNKVYLGGATLRTLPNLKHIAVIATGYNNVDLQTAGELGITVSNVRGYGRYTVPQHTFALILSLASRVIDYSRDVQQGDWEAQESFTLLRYPTFELAGKTIGIIGFGAIGRGTAGIAEGFGMRVLVNDAGAIDDTRYRNAPLEELLRESDILTVHAPLTEETRDLIGEGELRSMKRSALLINTARGGIVNESALLTALETGEIAGAGVDTLTGEPPRNNPLLYRGDLNLIITPHAAWSAREARQRLIDEVAENIAAFQNGTPRNLVG